MKISAAPQTLQTFTTSTPVVGPRSSVNSGAETSARPDPLTRCRTAPIITAKATAVAMMTVNAQLLTQLSQGHR